MFTIKYGVNPTDSYSGGGGGLVGGNKFLVYSSDQGKCKWNNDADEK